MTSNKEQDSISCLEDDGRNTNPAPDYDDMLDIYNAANADDSVRSEWDLVFHRVREELRGIRDDRQLIEWMLNTGLGLDYGEYIERAERFGEYSEDQVQPIRVKMSTVEEGREILRRAKNLGLKRDFGGIYILPFLSSSHLQEILNELEEKLSEVRTNGYPRARMEFWRIVQYDENGKPEVLYTPMAHDSWLEDRGTNTDAAFSYYMLRVYNAYNADDSARSEWDLVFHRVREGWGGIRDDRQLIVWVLKSCLELDHDQYIVKAERFGQRFEGRIQPIRVRLSTVDAGRKILRRAKNLGLQRHFGGIYIMPFLSSSHLQELCYELEEKLSEVRTYGYPRARIEFWRIVQYDENGAPEVLYTLMAHGSWQEDRGTNTDAAFDYDYMLKLYNAVNAGNGVRNKWDLVFHRVRKGFRGMVNDRQLIEWVLKNWLGLDYGQYIEKVQRFGIRTFEDQVQPIRVKMSTVEKGREILRRAKNLKPQRALGRLYIKPFLTSSRLKDLNKELNAMLPEVRRYGYPRARIAFYRIVQYDKNGEPEVLYTPSAVTHH